VWACGGAMNRHDDQYAELRAHQEVMLARFPAFLRDAEPDELAHILRCERAKLAFREQMVRLVEAELERRA
jgi:hypothetical protein